MLELISEPAKPVRENKESRLKADKEVVRIAWSVTHGMQSQANRAIHKPSAFYPPMHIGFNEQSQCTNQPSDEVTDDFDEFDGLHICFMTLAMG